MKLIQAASYILTRALGLNKLMDLEIYQLVDFFEVKVLCLSPSCLFPKRLARFSILFFLKGKC